MEKMDKRLMKAVGLKIKMLRIKANISQDDFSDMVDLNRVSISNIETGRQGTTVLFLLKSCKIFNCELTDIIPADFEIKIGTVKSEYRLDKKIEALQRQMESLKKLKTSSDE